MEDASYRCQRSFRRLASIALLVDYTLNNVSYSSLPAPYSSLPARERAADSVISDDGVLHNSDVDRVFADDVGLKNVIHSSLSVSLSYHIGQP